MAQLALIGKKTQELIEALKKERKQKSDLERKLMNGSRCECSKASKKQSSCGTSKETRSGKNRLDAQAVLDDLIKSIDTLVESKES